MDKEADKAYTANIPTLNTKNLRRGKQWRIYTTKNKEILEFTGHWRKQVLEEIRLKNPDI